MYISSLFIIETFENHLNFEFTFLVKFVSEKKFHPIELKDSFNICKVCKICSMLKKCQIGFLVYIPMLGGYEKYP